MDTPNMYVYKATRNQGVTSDNCRLYVKGCMLYNFGFKMLIDNINNYTFPMHTSFIIPSVICWNLSFFFLFIYNWYLNPSSLLQYGCAVRYFHGVVLRLTYIISDCSVPQSATVLLRANIAKSTVYVPRSWVCSSQCFMSIHSTCKLKVENVIYLCVWDHFM